MPHGKIKSYVSEKTNMKKGSHCYCWFRL